MSDLIKKLAEQAGYEKDIFGIGHWDMPECKKFAELMIGEVHYAIVVGGVQDLDILLEHFGVEE